MVKVTLQLQESDPYTDRTVVGVNGKITREAKEFSVSPEIVSVLRAKGLVVEFKAPIKTKQPVSKEE